MNKKFIPLIIILLFSYLFGYNQNNFSITNNQEREVIKFKLVNNLILLPVTLNGKELTFLLDTGVKQSLLFNITKSDSLDLKQIKKVKIRGLGTEEQFDGLKSKNNLLRINNVVCPNFDLLVIIDKKFDFSSRMGLDIHGIIGSELFMDFIIEVNYNKKRIIFNNPSSYKYKKCRKCETFPLTFHYKKPYIQGIVKTFDNKNYSVKLLIDSGGGDSLWLFKNSLSKYSIPPKNFKDLLGRGLNGNIFGQKSKLTSFKIGSFKFNNLIISHPDSSSTIGNNIHFVRNGLIGAELLKRFHIIYDYPHKKITLKKNKQNFKNQFFYNKSGIELIHYGKVLVREQKAKIVFNGNQDENNGISDLFSTFSYSFKNAYQISYIKPNSIAEKTGLQKGDLISKINGKEAYNFSLQQIIQRLSDKEGKRVRIQVNRNGNFYDYKIILKELL